MVMVGDVNVDADDDDDDDDDADAHDGKNGGRSWRVVP